MERGTMSLSFFGDKSPGIMKQKIHLRGPWISYLRPMKKSKRK